MRHTDATRLRALEAKARGERLEEKVLGRAARNAGNMKRIPYKDVPGSMFRGPPEEWAKLSIEEQHKIFKQYQKRVRQEQARRARAFRGGYL